MKKILVGIFLIGFSWSASAQVSQCEETLNLATEEFNAGHFFEIPAKLKECLGDDNFTREQRVRAYLLLSQVYLILDDQEAAEASYLKLLTADPEYIATKEKDPIDVVYLSSKFTSNPIFTPHVKIGINTSAFQTNGPFAESGTLKHGFRPGFQVGAGMDWNIDNNWSLCVDAVIATRSFKTTLNNIFPDTTGGFTSDRLIAIERLTFLDIPVYLKYSVDKGRIRPFAYAGLAANLLISSKDKIRFENNTGANSTISQGPDENLKYLRKTLSKSILLGGGLKYKIGKDYIFADLRLMIGTSNVVTGNVFSPDPSKIQNGSYPNGLNSLLTQYGFVSSAFRIDNLMLSFGYIRPLYNPRKIKKTRVNSLLHIFDRKKQ